MIRYQDVTPDELFEVARLVVSAEIAKIHTIEWTPQLLYNEPLYARHERQLERPAGRPAGRQRLPKRSQQYRGEELRQVQDVKKATQWYSVFASGPGIFGLGSKVSHDDIRNPNTSTAA